MVERKEGEETAAEGEEEEKRKEEEGESYVLGAPKIQPPFD